MNTLTIHKTTHASTSYGWLEYGLEYRIGNAEIHRIFSSSLIHCALDYCFHCLDSISSYQIGQYQVLALNEILYLIQYWFLSCQVLLSETKIKIWH